VGGLLSDLSHPHYVQRRVEAVEGSGIHVELVAQDQHEISERFGALFLHGSSRAGSSRLIYDRGSGTVAFVTISSQP
jgi:hypothetical protein